MKRWMTCVAFACALAFGMNSVWAADKPAKAKLPDAANAAIAKAFPKASIGDAELLGQGKTQCFTVAMKEAGKQFYVVATPGGVITEVNSHVAVADLPKAVTAAANKAAADAGAAGAKITSPNKLERRADDDNKPLDKPETSYYLVLSKGDRIGSMVVAEDGTVKDKLEM